MNRSSRESPAPGSIDEGLRPPPANEEPEFNSEEDIPSDDHEDAPVTPPEDESVAGEEDPGAAMDTPRSP